MSRHLFSAALFSSILSGCTAEATDATETSTASEALRRPVSGTFRGSPPPVLRVPRAGVLVRRQGETTGINAELGVTDSRAWCLTGEEIVILECESVSRLADDSPGLVEIDRSVSREPAPDGRAVGRCVFRNVAPRVVAGQPYTVPQTGRSWVVCGR